MVYRKARSVARMNPGEWSCVIIGDTIMLVLSCPSCRQQSVIDHLRVSFDGAFNDGKCPYIGCGAARAGALEEWTP